jgi:tetratricopeptide (TPR) repeat protein
MRTSIALAICVSLTTGLFAEGPLEGPAAEWTTVYDAGMAAGQRQSYEEAVALFERSWDLSRTPAEQGASATDLGQTYRHLGRMNEAKFWLERARQAWRTDPRQGSEFAVTSSTLADVYRVTGDYERAEQLLREVLVSPASDPASRGLVRNNLADLLREEGRSTEALPLFKESLGATGATSAATWKQRVGALIGLADIDRQYRDWDASVDKWNEVLVICRRERDKETEALALRGLGETWLRSGTTARAEPLLRRSLQMMEDNPDTLPEQIASAHSGMGELYRTENKLTLAENEWSRALQIVRTAFGEAHPQVAWLMEMLSDVYSARKEFVLAREYAARASETMRGSFGEDSMPVAVALTNQALVEQRASNLEAAAKDYERAIGIARIHPEHRSLQVVMIQRYAELLKAMHRSREAKTMLTQGDIQARSFQLK